MFLRFIQNNKRFVLQRKKVFSAALRQEKIQSIIFLLLILFLPTQLGKHFWPSFSFVEGIRVDYLSPTIYLTDILACLYIFFSLKNIRFPKILFLVLLFVSLGIFFSSSPLSGWYTLIKFVEFVFLSLSIAYSFKKSQIGFLTACMLGIGIVFESLLGLAQFIYARSLGGIFYFFGERTFSGNTPGIANASINGQLILRPYGTLPHPNVLAGHVLISILLFLGLLEKRTSKKMLPLILMVCVVAVMGIAISFSRSASILSVILVVVYLLTRFKKTFWKTFSSIGIGISSLCLFSTLFPMFLGRFTFSLTDESITQREFLATAALRMIVSHPVLGVGFGNFFTNVTQSSKNSSIFLLLQPVHNIFLLLIATAGIPFFLLTIWFLYKTIKKMFQETSQTFYRTTLFVSLVSILFLGQLDHYFLTVQQGQLLVAVIIGLCWNLILTSRNKA